jgi:hypothetical protein
MESESDVSMQLDGESDFEDNCMHDDSDDEENDMASPSPKKPKAKAKGRAEKVLKAKESSLNIAAPAQAQAKAKASSKQTKTVEEIYQKKTPLEHILLRPDTYSKLLLIAHCTSSRHPSRLILTTLCSRIHGARHQDDVRS